MAQSVLKISAVDNASRVLGQIDRSAKKLNTSIGKTGGKVKDVAKGTAGLGLAAKGATPGVASLGAAVQFALGPIALLGGALGLLSGGLNAIVQQDKAAAALRTLGVSAEEFAPKLLAVSEELGHQVSQTELTAAAYEVVSAGFTDASDAAEVLKASTLAAGAGLAELAPTADAVTTVLNAWGMSGKDATSVADKMQQTVADGKIKIEQYAANIGKVATTAAQLKVPLSNVNAAISQATVSGVNAERAFTGVNAALAQIAGGQAGKELGIEMNAATLESEGLFETLKKIAAVPVGQQIKALGREGHAALGPVLADLDKFEQLIKKQEASAGVANKAFEETQDSIGGAWKELTNVLGNAFSQQSELGEAVKLTIKLTTDGLKIIGWLLEPPIAGLNKILNLVVQIGNKIRELREKAGGWLEKFFGPPVAIEESAAGQLATETEKVATNLGSAGEKIDEVTTKLSSAKPPISDLKDEATLASKAFDDIGKSIGEGLVTAIKEVVKGTQTLGQTAANVLNRISDMLLDFAIKSAMVGLAGGPTSGFAKFLGFADGGRPPVGKPSIVGERGPEVFVPNSAGTIVPNHQLGGDMSVSVNVDASGSNVQGDQPTASQLGRLIGSAIQAELIKQKRPGGLLTA